MPYGNRSSLGEIIGRQSTFLFLTNLVQRVDIRPPEGQKTINVQEHTVFTTALTHFEVRLIPRVRQIQRQDQGRRPRGDWWDGPPKYEVGGRPLHWSPQYFEK